MGSIGNSFYAVFNNLNKLYSERSLNPPPLIAEYDFGMLTPAGFGCKSDQKPARQTRIYFIRFLFLHSLGAIP